MPTYERTRIPGSIDAAIVASVQLPLALPNCQGWYEAHSISGTADNTAIASWADLSGNGKNFGQLSAGAKPKFRTARMSGYAGIEFDATDDTMTSTLALSTSTYSIYIVYASNAGAGGGHRVLQGASNNWLIGPYNGSFNFYNGGFITGPTASAGLYKCQHVVADGSGAEMFINNASQGTNGNTTAPGTVVLGPGGAFGEIADSTVLEWAAYSSKHSTADQLRMWLYLKDKYAIT
jgi:hypothetical protein